jgi:hypothetical protein
MRVFKYFYCSFKDSITMENKLIWEGSATAVGMYKDIHREA